MFRRSLGFSWRSNFGNRFLFILFRRSNQFLCGPGYLSRYSNWLRAGRSGDRILAGARFSAPVQTGPGAHTATCTVGTGSFPGVKSGRAVTLTPHPLLVSLVKKRVELYPYSPYGPYGLYKGALF